MSDYPEHDRLLAVSDESQVIGEFLDTFDGSLCRWREEGNSGAAVYEWADGVKVATRDGKPSKGRKPTHVDYLNGDARHNPDYCEWEGSFVPVPGTINQILAGHFGIDLDLIDAEKRAMLDAIRAAT